MTVLVILQNAWSPLYSGEVWPRASWLKALARSRSGQRLRVLEEASPGFDFYYENTTAICGESPNSVVPADLNHLQRILKYIKPQCTIALGKQAANAMKQLIPNGPLLTMPHPACRIVTNALYIRGGEILLDGVSGVKALSQGYGVVIEQ